MNLDEFAGRLHWMDDLALVAGTSCLYQVSADARRVLREGGPPPVEIEREWSLLGRLGYWPGTACRQEHPFAQAVINVAHACDMACSYCNVDQGHYRASPTVMSPQMGRRIVRALLSLTRERHLDLSLFGGEPMLAWTTVQAVLDEAASSGRRWYKRIFTNGLLLTPESAEFFRRHDVEVVVSLDGPPEIHDKHRVNHRREGSYERVMRGIDLLKAAGARVRAVATVAAEFMSMRPQIEAFLQERLGSDAPVAAELEDCARRDVYPGGQLQYEADREREQIDAFLEGAASSAPAFTRMLLDDFLRGPHMRPVVVCPAGVVSLTFTPDGDVYSCRPSVVIGQEWKIASVHDPDLERHLKAFQAGFTSDAPECRDCWARAVCGRGCHLSRTRKGVNPDTCRYFMDLIERAAQLAPRLAVEKQMSSYRMFSAPDGLEGLRKAFEARESLWRLLRFLRPIWLFPWHPKRQNPCGN